MSRLMNHRGYYATKIEFDDEAGVFCGVVADIWDIVHFEGTSVDELRQAFRDSVDDYLEWCEERGKEPNRPFSGKVLLRMEPSLHREVARRAQRANSSLNAYVVGLLSEVCAQERSPMALAPTR